MRRTTTAQPHTIAIMSPQSEFTSKSFSFKQIWALSFLFPFFSTLLLPQIFPPLSIKIKPYQIKVVPLPPFHSHLFFLIDFNPPLFLLKEKEKKQVFLFFLKYLIWYSMLISSCSLFFHDS